MGTCFFSSDSPRITILKFLVWSLWDIVLLFTGENILKKSPGISFPHNELFCCDSQSTGWLTGETWVSYGDWGAFSVSLRCACGQWKTLSGKAMVPDCAILILCASWAPPEHTGSNQSRNPSLMLTVHLPWLWGIDYLGQQHSLFELCRRTKQCKKDWSLNYALSIFW